MSGINRFLSRREKRSSASQYKKVMSPPSLPPPSYEGQSSASSSSGRSALFSSYNFSSSSSLSSLSVAFPAHKRNKSSPHLQATEGLVVATTANWDDDFLLQPLLVSGDLYGLFVIEGKKKPDKDEEKKIKALIQQLSRHGITSLKEPQVEYALRAKYSGGDPQRAFDLLVLLEDSIEGIVKSYEPSVKLLGAENREKVTCYLDALLFAMFARLGSFEGILYSTSQDEQRKRLGMLLRLWVNMLRTGKLITTDITRHLQEALAACGWIEASELYQQDASEAFSFITEQLDLPLLTLKMDIFHTGKEEATDDHKFINERLLEVSIPADPEDGKGITLEDCLETYFNNRIEVKRHLERRRTVNSVRSTESLDSPKAPAYHVEATETDSLPSSPTTSSPMRPTQTRHRAPSIIQERFVAREDDASNFADEKASLSTRQRRGTIRKEVMMPAWQFFSLIPWYTDNAPKSDAQVAAHFSSTRPVLGLCLKRYSMLPDGTAKRLDTFIDIPLEIALPHFIQDDRTEEGGPLFGNFKLSLQSVVCHRGTSIHSGHYVSLVRGTAPNAVTLHETAPNNEDREDRWMLFDDLAKERVSYVDIKESLRTESPYLLFYQVQPIEEDFPHPSTADDPPPYAESQSGDSGTPVSTLTPQLSFGTADRSEFSRPSLELPSSDNDPRGRSSILEDRRPSLTFLDGSTSNEPRPDQLHSMPVQPIEDGSGSFSNSTRRELKAKKGGSSSRSASQAGENRMSATFSRITSRMSRDKLQAPDSNTDGVTENGIIVVDVDELLRGNENEKSKNLRDKIRSRSRRGSGHLGKASKKEGPDRECTVM
ncbi:MAG: hypothetical protein M1812_002272 [Candelaria pacifica]|nr:MAG: hypothetical protein M1812_002272 [Candelaria pacifica]